jgi:hypothetical protein
VALGTVVLLEADEEGAAEGQAGAKQQLQHDQYEFGQVQCMWTGKDGAKMAQVRWVWAGWLRHVVRNSPVHECTHWDRADVCKSMQSFACFASCHVLVVGQEAVVCGCTGKTVAKGW